MPQSPLAWQRVLLPVLTAACSLGLVVALATALVGERPADPTLATVAGAPTGSTLPLRVPEPVPTIDASPAALRAAARAARAARIAEDGPHRLGAAARDAELAAWIRRHGLGATALPTPTGPRHRRRPRHRRAAAPPRPAPPPTRHPPPRCTPPTS